MRQNFIYMDQKIIFNNVLQKAVLSEAKINQGDIKNLSEDRKIIIENIRKKSRKAKL